ncbi:MAG: TetR/AcrR family transcriptional regulator [Paracoccaceae bacterium]
MRKTPQTWIDAGLKALQTHGPDGLRAETLARDLGATKGSFYWHFKDVPAFHDTILAQWSDAMFARMTDALAKGDTPVTQLRNLSQMRPSKLDIAIRAWATFDKRANKTVKAMDTKCIKIIADLLNQLDAPHPEFPELVHAAMIATPSTGHHGETLVDLLLALR